MEKLKLDGGIKLIKIKLKSVTPKIKWLIELLTNKELTTHLLIFRQLIGQQN